MSAYYDQLHAVTAPAQGLEPDFGDRVLAYPDKDTSHAELLRMMLGGSSDEDTTIALARFLRDFLDTLANDRDKMSDRHEEQIMTAQHMAGVLVELLRRRDEALVEALKGGK
ncbi:MAG: hypothetical protein R3B72_01400 [Polyangiaceae bacterium]